MKIGLGSREAAKDAKEKQSKGKRRTRRREDANCAKEKHSKGKDLRVVVG